MKTPGLPKSGEDSRPAGSECQAERQNCCQAFSQKLPNVFVAGQLSGVEGYTESAACGIIAAINVERKALGLPFIEVPTTTVTGALLRYILTAPEKSFSPMNANWALFPNVDKKQREEYASFALSEIESYYKRVNE